MDGNSAAPKVKTEIQDRVGVITLSDPSTLNAAGAELMSELQAAVDDFIHDDAVRAIVITGEGRGFCSGANLSGGSVSGRGGSKGPNESLLKVYNPFVST